MHGSARPLNRNLRISPVDRRGRTISHPVLVAAEKIGRRAMEHAEPLLFDPAIAATLLEEAAASVSRALLSKRHSRQAWGRDLPSYLFRAFIRPINPANKRPLIQKAAILAHLPELPHYTGPNHLD